MIEDRDQINQVGEDDLDQAQPFAGPEGAALAKRGKLTGFQIVMGVIALAGGVGVIWMRQVGTESGMDFQSAPQAFETSLKTPAAQQEFDRAMQALADSRAPIEVPDHAFRQDPFKVMMADNSEADARQLAELERQRQRAADEEARRMTERRRELQMRLSRLRLQSAMGGRTPIANVNGRLVRVGEKIDDFFTVEEIDAGRVVVKAHGERYELRMGRDMAVVPLGND